MPTYHYKCPECGHEYDKLQKMSNNTRAKCPKCGTRGERVISGGAGLIFKGSGFYLTDYGRAGSDAKTGGEKAEKTDKAVKGDKPEKKAAEKPAEKKTPGKGADS